MALDSFIDKLPEEIRESYKSEIASAILIKSREDADKYISDHPLLKSARDAIISRTTENYAKKYQEETLPKILEEERKKGQKQPWEIEIEKLKSEQLADKKALAIERQKARAYSKAQSEGIPISMVEKYIGETDEDTDKGLEYLFSIVKPWVIEKENKLKAQFMGNQGSPKGGSDNDPVSLQDKYNKAVKDGNADLALAIQSKMQELKRG